jgi:hypothetical protein
LVASLKQLHKQGLQLYGVVSCCCCYCSTILQYKEVDSSTFPGAQLAGDQGADCQLAGRKSRVAAVLDTLYAVTQLLAVTTADGVYSVWLDE